MRQAEAVGQPILLVRIDGSIRPDGGAAVAAVDAGDRQKALVDKPGGKGDGSLCFRQPQAGFDGVIEHIHQQGAEVACLDAHLLRHVGSGTEADPRLLRPCGGVLEQHVEDDIFGEEERRHFLRPVAQAAQVFLQLSVLFPGAEQPHGHDVVLPFVANGVGAANSAVDRLVLLKHQAALELHGLCFCPETHEPRDHRHQRRNGAGENQIVDEPVEDDVKVGAGLEKLQENSVDHVREEAVGNGGDDVDHQQRPCGHQIDDTEIFEEGSFPIPNDIHVDEQRYQEPLQIQQERLQKVVETGRQGEIAVGDYEMEHKLNGRCRDEQRQAVLGLVLQKAEKVQPAQE